MQHSALRVGSAIADGPHPVSDWRRLAQGRLITVSRTAYQPAQTYPAHRHTYAEVFWIEHGSITNASATGDLHLGTGDCCLIQPRCRHALHTDRRERCVLVNVAVPWPQVERVRAHYDLPSDVWGTPRAPARHRLGGRNLAALEDWARRLATAGDDPLLRDAFLLDLFARLRTVEQGWGTCPAWLREAIETVRHPPHLAVGGVALVRLCGRSREHVSRTVHRHLGCTAADLVAGLRLDHAYRLLTTTDLPVQDILVTCGTAGSAHFLRRFRARYGASPMATRARLRD